MNKRRLFPIVVALLLAVLTVSAQDDSPRQIGVPDRKDIGSQETGRRLRQEAG